MIGIAVMASGHGRGSNMQAIIDACADGRVDGRVAVVIGVSEAPAIERARSQGIPTEIVSPREPAYPERLCEALARHGADLVCLAGYMRILPGEVISAYPVMNIHPALIPLFCGKGMYGEHVHRAAVEYGVKVSGCTVHFVDGNYDTGPIILQKCVPVCEGDTPETLAARVLEQEHIAYPEAVALFAEGRLKAEGRIVHILPKE